MKKPKPPKSLDAITDLVLAYRPKPKSKPAKKRKRRQITAQFADGLQICSPVVRVNIALCPPHPSTKS